MAKTLKIWLYPQGWNSSISYSADEIVEASKDGVIFKQRSEVRKKVLTKTVTSNLPYIIEEEIESSGSITI